MYDEAFKSCVRMRSQSVDLCSSDISRIQIIKQEAANFRKQHRMIDRLKKEAIAIGHLEPEDITHGINCEIISAVLFDCGTGATKALFYSEQRKVHTHTHRHTHFTHTHALTHTYTHSHTLSLTRSTQECS